MQSQRKRPSLRPDARSRASPLTGSSSFDSAWWPAQLTAAQDVQVLQLAHKCLVA